MNPTVVKVNMNIKNIEEFRKLTEQLQNQFAEVQQTIEEINHFRIVIEVTQRSEE